MIDVDTHQLALAAPPDLASAVRSRDASLDALLVDQRRRAVEATQIQDMCASSAMLLPFVLAIARAAARRDAEGLLV